MRLRTVDMQAPSHLAFARSRFLVLKGRVFLLLQVRLPTALGLLSWLPSDEPHRFMMCNYLDLD